MLYYLLGFLTLPAVFGVFIVVRSILNLWDSVRKYGGEDERALTPVGRVIQRVMLHIAK